MEFMDPRSWNTFCGTCWTILLLPMFLKRINWLWSSVTFAGCDSVVVDKNCQMMKVQNNAKFIHGEVEGSTSRKFLPKNSSLVSRNRLKRNRDPFRKMWRNSCRCWWIFKICLTKMLCKQKVHDLLSAIVTVNPLIDCQSTSAITNWTL